MDVLWELATDDRSSVWTQLHPNVFLVSPSFKSGNVVVLLDADKVEDKAECEEDGEEYAPDSQNSQIVGELQMLLQVYGHLCK